MMERLTPPPGRRRGPRRMAPVPSLIAGIAGLLAVAGCAVQLPGSGEPAMCASSERAAPGSTPARTRPIMSRWWPHSRVSKETGAGSYRSGVQSVAPGPVAFSNVGPITPPTV